MKDAALFTLIPYLFVLIAYLIGAIPFGYIMGKLSGVDLRKHGSKNIGATNAWRVLGAAKGLTVFILDFLKGFLPVLGAYLWVTAYQSELSDTAAILTVVLVGFATIIGHTYTCFLNFKGGKGVATTAGVLFAFSWEVGLVTLLSWIVPFRLSGYVSLGSIIAAGVMMVYGSYYFWPFGEHGDIANIAYVAFFIFIGSLVIIKHRANIGRLMRGEESSILKSKKKA